MMQTERPNSEQKDKSQSEAPTVEKINPSENNPEIKANIIPEKIIIANLGKLKKTLTEKCPNCGGLLQVRTFEFKTIEEGIDILKTEDVIMCLECDYEKECKKKRSRRKERESIEEEINAYKKNRKSESIKSRTPRNRDKGYRKSHN